jgi:hypothetical protein
MTMKKITLTKSAAPAAFCAGLCLAGGALSAQAQVTPEQKSLLKEFFANRAETAIILSGSDSIGGGNFTVESDRNDDIEFSLLKLGGSGQLGNPRPMGDTGVKWSPYLRGVVGFASADNEIKFGTLAGNDLEETTFAVQFGGGVTFWMTDHLRVTPSVGVLYGYYETELDDSTPAGTAAKPILDLELQTLGATPGIELAYAIPAGKITFDLSTKYTLYATGDISDDDKSNGLEADGTTHVWENKVDVDIPLGLEMFNCQWHTGGFVGHTALFGDVTDSLATDNYFTIHPRFVANTEGKLWKVSRLGLGASYYVGEDFSGWDIGVEVNFKF